jgi:hypothetical protein
MRTSEIDDEDRMGDRRNYEKGNHNISDVRELAPARRSRHDLKSMGDGGRKCNECSGNDTVGVGVGCDGGQGNGTSVGQDNAGEGRDEQAPFNTVRKLAVIPELHRSWPSSSGCAREDGRERGPLQTTLRSVHPRFYKPTPDPK